MQDKRILIGTPINARSWITPYYLRNLYNLEYNKKLIDIYWILNNADQETEKSIYDFRQLHKDEYNSIIIEKFNKVKFNDERTDKIRKKYTYSFLAEIRNKLMQKCIKLNCDFLFSTDSDILFRKDILNRLLSHDKDIVSSLIYNSYLYTPDSPWSHPNILREIAPRQYEHISNYRIKNPDKNSIGKIISVDFTGACVLMSQDVCKKTKYGYNGSYGEDEPWSYSARQAGINLWCDISMYSQHIMSPQFLEQFKDFGIE